MRRPAITHFIGIVLFFVSVSFLVWGFYPQRHETQILRIPGFGQQNLMWTSRIRSGETGVLKLDFNPAELGLGGFSADEVGWSESHPIRTSPILTSDQILVETRIEMLGVILDPGEELIQPLQSGKKLSFIWQINPIISGDLEGEIWFYIKNLSKIQNGENRQPISVLNIHVHSVDLFGMTGHTARILGIIGTCMVLVMGRGLITNYANLFIN